MVSGRKLGERTARQKTIGEFLSWVTAPCAKHSRGTGIYRKTTKPELANQLLRDQWYCAYNISWLGLGIIATPSAGN